MHRILSRLHHGQLLASVAVIVVASVTFAFLALLGANQQGHIETDALLDTLQARVVQLGTIHSDIANANDVSRTDIDFLTQIRQ